ncbi:MAG: crossover junction endodeoxyribonuclease RuvC [Myxococcota bacterium]|nr:crossover junction endodeoxyribonuclease RuvC [Myxococcota bacterium]
MSPRVIGIDPGTRITGYGVVERQGNQLRLLRAGVIRTDAGAPLYQRLDTIYRELSAVIRETQPEVAAVESLFAARNAASALKLGHARGVALLALVHGGLAVHDYAPSEVKQAVVGTGRGQKEQVAQMIRNLLGLKEIPPPDAADALAVAVCQLMHRALPGALATR